MTVSEVLAFLCGEPASGASSTIAGWITESKRFHAFAVCHRAKIRKKLRTATTPEALWSVLMELDVARQLVEDPRCTVEYERYGQGRVRSPDLTLTFRARTTVHLEVTQVRAPAAEWSEWEGKLIGIVCHKLGQMMPEEVNLLVVGPDKGSLSIEDVTRAMKRLKRQVEQRESDLLPRFGFGGRSDFFKQFQWLSGIVVWSRPDHGALKTVWTNPAARRPLPAAVARLLCNSFEVSGPSMRNSRER
jgi:hypothetical protein